jgi:predicted dehydrogenase/threonine dehydrogenase-like Zn-dependent dehydrogenase
VVDYLFEMKQLAQYQDGRLELQDVPAPQPPPGGILVRTTCSVISPGTEKMKVEQARMSLLQKARARPDQVRKVLDTARTLGWKAAYEKVRNRLESPTPLGYSAAGVVVAVDPLNNRFKVGDRVACGGAECAFHAELIAVPDLLAAAIPESVADWQAAYTTLASISLQAVRQAEPRLGDRVLVIGQGLVGLLATRLLASSGARVMAVDFDPRRLQVATTMGAEHTVNPAAGSIVEHALDWTQGAGVDAVLICVGGKGASTADTAITSLRDRGIMVIVGIHDAELAWKTAYMKDIQVRYSRSYGPGRYDPSYEWGGVDYPIGHVRWTENRNFEACLHLMKSGGLDLAPLTTRQAHFADAITVYNELMQPGNTDIGVVLEYEKSSSSALPEPGTSGQMPEPLLSGQMPEPLLSGKMPELHVIGAGNFARTMLLPHLAGEMTFASVINGTGLSAEHVKQKFGFRRADTQAEEVFAAPGEAVLIATRHHLHAPLVLRGLAANQHLFVEKPLCLTETELSEIDVAMRTTQGSVMVGFNRRFAPATTTVKQLLKSVPGPRCLAYHVFAGPLPKDHWYANESESGGRILGEACHFFDFFCHLIDSPAISVSAQAIGRSGLTDSVMAQVAFADGSNAQLIYTAGGDYAFPKETWRVFANGLVAECENFQKLTLFRRRKRETQSHRSKGHAEEMTAWRDFLGGKAPHPLPYAASRQSMLLTFAALRSIRENKSLAL